MLLEKLGNYIALVLLLSAFCLDVSAAKVTVDGNGVMRRSDTNEEVAYYGVNYTVPFAHAYRALEALGVDRKAAIDRDVYHFARLGFNAFRLHLWDVELTDSLGNLQENTHLDLLDYLIYKVEERGISVVLTAQTNFGNGYPERNTDTGGYSYRYDKCRVHDTEAAVQAQERYLKALVSHRNPYTGKTYSADDLIIAIEVNNEPCHSGDAKQVRSYVDRMVKCLKKAGFKKPVFYNVSHNMYATESFYQADIDGTTYQWYPIGLVAGRERKGNFLPFVDTYDIPFSGVPHFGEKAKMVYEFDPADNLYSYVYPAMTRAFRSAGFQWITQFAYDPIDMAWANTEYQTHFLNLAYTPRKALAMKISGEVARTVARGADFGAYPQDTVFGDFRVSYRQDLSECNTAEKFFYTNNTQTRPKDAASLREIAGWGKSPVVAYEGTGAYFLDRVDAGVWRLEVMPDVVLTADPFATPSLGRRVAALFSKKQPIVIDLPSLGKGYYYKGVNSGNGLSGRAEEGGFAVEPGVYLLSASGDFSSLGADTPFGNIRLGEYVAPAMREEPLRVTHTPQPTAIAGEKIVLTATVTGTESPDSVMVYEEGVSMWAAVNPIHKMRRVSEYQYECEIGIGEGKDCFRYNIVAFRDGKPSTFPAGECGSPLDWDYRSGACYAVKNVRKPQSELPLLTADRGLDGAEVWSVAAAQNTRIAFERRAPLALDAIRFGADGDDMFLLKKYVGDVVGACSDASQLTSICVSVADAPEAGEVEVAVVTSDGAAFSAKIPSESGVAEIPLSSLAHASTLLCPAPYPVFLKRSVTVPASHPLTAADIEYVELRVLPKAGDGRASLSVSGIWLK